MHDRRIQILRYLDREPATAKEIAAGTGIGLSAVYRHLKWLSAAKQGYAAKKGERYEVLPAGQAAVVPGAVSTVEPATTAAAGPSLLDFLPHLHHVPTVHHRQTLELIHLSAIARHHALGDEHHLSYYLIAEPLKLKTWVPRAACLMHGLDDAQFVLDLTTERGRSVSNRRNSAGKEVWRRDALAAAIVGLDEYPEAATEVRRELDLYLLGKRRVATPDGPATVGPVPVITGNPRSGNTLRARAGFSKRLARRAMLLDFDAVDIPEDMALRGEALLEQIGALAPAELPAPRYADWDPSARVLAGFKSQLTDLKHLAEIDITAIAKLVVAATAYLEKEEALHLVLHNWCSLMVLAGWVVEDWRIDIPLEPTPVSPAAIAIAKAPIADRDRWAFNDHVREVTQMLLKHGLSPLAARGAIEFQEDIVGMGFSIDAIRSLAKAARADGLAPGKAVTAVVELIGSVGSLAKARAVVEEETKNIRPGRRVGSGRKLRGYSLAVCFRRWV